MKKTIQLNESDITRMVMEAVNELDWKTYANAEKKEKFKPSGKFGRSRRFGDAAEDAFNRDFGTDDTQLNRRLTNTHIPGMGPVGMEDFRDDSSIIMNKPEFPLNYYRYQPTNEPRNRHFDFSNSDQYPTSKHKEEWDRAKNELDHYKNGDYEYKPGEGWQLKDKNESIVREAVNRTLRKYLR